MLSGLMLALAALSWFGSAAAVIWIVVIAVQEEDYIWAVASFFCGIATLIYAIMKLPKTTIPLIMLVAFPVLASVLFVATALLAPAAVDTSEEFDFDNFEEFEIEEPFGLKSSPPAELKEPAFLNASVLWA